MKGEAGPVFRVIQVSRVQMNPYVRLLRGALERTGVECLLAERVSPHLVRSWRGTADLLHIHWLDLLYASPRLRRRLRLWASVMVGLLIARSESLGIVYTIHNLSPHESSFRWLDHLAQVLVLRMAQAVHVHDDDTASEVARRYGRSQEVYVIPHGSYVGAYPNDCTRGQARLKLALDERHFVYLFLGQIRRYKGVEELIASFQLLDDADARLLVAGNAHDAEYAAELQCLVRDDNRVTLRLEYVPDSDVQYYLNACDVCVLPYRSMTTSGAAILAFSFGCPIIVPALPAFGQLAAGGRGTTYEPGSADGLRHALQAARCMDLTAATEATLAWANEHDWDTLVPRFREVYMRASGTGRR